ncbi:MAG TPA: aminotransferase class I/II-fold pyridoxal phosphate-dependent enzyme [Fimbriimonadales bacterium]|nr:aminotransferase class I/II-fold pyridoxal phosphate-dependent enzyme [Fimbriimonadales bacterium]
MSVPSPRMETRLIHAGEPEPRIRDAVVTPIFQSSTYLFTKESEYHDIHYLRLNNSPNHEVLHAKIAALENSEAGLVASSGMAIITTALLTVLKTGDHLLAQKGLYGGTHDFIVKDLPALGIEYTFVSIEEESRWKEHLRPNTKVFYCESITNPLMEVGDLGGVAKFAKEHGLVSMIDNTFATPINFRPLEHGFDLVLHSATKYLNGHSDIVAGAGAGRAELIERIRQKLNHFGGTLDPHACFLLHRGLKTLAVRVRYQNESALRIAEFLESRPQVARVNYPGLQSSASYPHAKKLFEGFGGMLSFELKGGADAAKKFMEKVRIPLVAPSLGGVETLVILPAKTSHSALDVNEREELGIREGLIRVSVGLEAVEDLIADFDTALSP